MRVSTPTRARSSPTTQPRRSSAPPRSARRSRHRRPQRHRDLRPGPRLAHPTGRIGAVNPTDRIRADGRRIERTATTDRRTGRRRGRHRCASRRSSARTCRARSADASACRRCRSASSPIRRSRSSRTIDVARAFVAAARTGSTSRSTSSPPGAITALQAIRRGRRIPVPLIGPEWAIVRALTYLARRTGPRPRDRDDAPRPARRQARTWRSCSGSPRRRPPRGDRRALPLADRGPRPASGRSPDGRSSPE